MGREVTRVNGIRARGPDLILALLSDGLWKIAIDGAYWPMHSTNVDLLKASDAADSYAVAAEGDDVQGPWRAERGYGSAFQKVWSVEFQSRTQPDLRQVDWDAVLDRAIEAYDLNDPIITDFEWPLRPVPQS